MTRGVACARGRTRRQLMHRQLAALVVASVCVAALANAGVSAQWRDSIELPQQLMIGTAHFAAGDPTTDGSALPAPYRDAWTMPAGGLGTAENPLEPGGTFTHVVQLDAFSDGNRGMRVGLKDVEIADVEGAGQLAARLSLVAHLVMDPATCTAQAAAPTDPLFAGSLADAAFPPLVLNVPGGSSSSISFLCLRFTLDPDLVTRYVNVATVAGQVAGDEATDVSARSWWHATVARPAAAYAPRVTFTFDHETFRGAQP